MRQRTFRRRATAAPCLVLLLTSASSLAPLACSTAPTSQAADPNGAAGDGGNGEGTGDGGGTPGLASSDAGCTTAQPPTGPSCACHFTSCDGSTLECDCAPECYKTKSDCLISVDQGGAAHSPNPILSTCTIDCHLEPGTTGEFPKPPQMVCAVHDCTTPIAPPPPPPPPTGGVDGGVCPVPVPGPVVLPGPVWGDYGVHFYIPFPSWAFAAAHASRQMNWLASQKIALRASPSAYFATALKESYMGCSDKLPPLDLYTPGYLYQRTASYGDGCLQIESTTAWTEMCRMYPETIDCAKVTHADVVSSVNQDQTGRDNFASSAFVKAYYDTYAYAMLQTHDMPSPNTWFAGASDPQAMTKVMALVYNVGAWSGTVNTVANGCQHDLIENCLANKDYVVAVSSYTRQLEETVAAGNCYNETISVNDVDEYVARIVVLFTHENGAALTAAGRKAFLLASGGASTAPFQRVAGAVLDALEGLMQAKVHCPDAALNQWYGHHCPL